MPEAISVWENQPVSAMQSRPQNAREPRGWQTAYANSKTTCRLGGPHVSTGRRAMRFNPGIARRPRKTNPCRSQGPPGAPRACASLPLGLALVRAPCSVSPTLSTAQAWPREVKGRPTEAARQDSCSTATNLACLCAGLVASTTQPRRPCRDLFALRAIYEGYVFFTRITMLGGEAIPLQRFGLVPLLAVALSEHLPVSVADGEARLLRAGLTELLPVFLQGVPKIALSLKNLEI